MTEQMQIKNIFFLKILLVCTGRRTERVTNKYIELSDCTILESCIRVICEKYMGSILFVVTQLVGIHCRKGGADDLK